LNLAGGDCVEDIKKIEADDGFCEVLKKDECACDMPRGAVEEKNFIRTKLSEGLILDAVTNLVNERYGQLKT